MKKILIFGIGNWMDIISSVAKRHLPSTEVLIVGESEFEDHKDDFDVLILDDCNGSFYGDGWKMLDVLNENQKQKTIIHSWDHKFEDKAKAKGFSHYIDFRGKRSRDMDSYVLEKFNLVKNV